MVASEILDEAAKPLRKIEAVVEPDRTFPHEVTEEEAEAGFTLREIERTPGGSRALAVVADLVGGLRAVKTVCPPSEQVEYAIWDQGSVSIYISARTLADLMRRFPVSRPG